MTAHKHTAGTWQLDTTRAYWIKDCVRVNGVIVCEMRKRTTMTDVEYRANGALLAAAPELLEALERVLDQWREFRIVGPTVYQDAKAAISKAKGE